MKLDKANKRDKKLTKKKHGHRVDNRSIFVIVGIQVKKSQDIKKNK
jgi:hypothetical protein